jgi:hypothetical protein
VSTRQVDHALVKEFMSPAVPQMGGTPGLFMRGLVARNRRMRIGMRRFLTLPLGAAAMLT